MRRKFLLGIFGSDLVALLTAISISSWFVFGTPVLWNARELAGRSAWTYGVLLVLGLAVGSYSSMRTWTTRAPRPTYGRAVAIVSTTGAFTAIGLSLLRPYFSRPHFVTTMVTFLVFSVAHRIVRRRRPWTEHFVVVTNEKNLATEIDMTAHAIVELVLSPQEQPPTEPIAPGTTLVVDLRAVLSEEMAQYVSSLSMAGYTVRGLLNVYEEHTERLPMVHLAEGWELSAPVARNAYAPVKRLVDTLVTFVTAPLWLLIMGVVAIVVRLDSPGPVIFKQQRVGLSGENFILYKFRTMQVDAEKDGPRFASVGDPRITRSGRFLRKSRLDELPQLVNVLRGELSLVGPRPERPVFVRDFSRRIPFYTARTLVRPGVTGWAQVNYGYADDVADTIEKLTFDLYYVKHMSAWLDVQILGQSIWTVLTGNGAR